MNEAFYKNTKVEHAGDKCPPTRYGSFVNNRCEPKSVCVVAFPCLNREFCQKSWSNMMISFLLRDMDYFSINSPLKLKRYIITKKYKLTVQSNVAVVQMI